METPANEERSGELGGRSGTLYLVATPIGNLDDITLRALRTLASVDWIAAEDTRRTGILLSRHGIGTSMVPYHAHNEHRSLDGLLRRLRGGASGAIVTDAGTPGISDPGFLLTRACIQEGIPVEVVPGPSAVLTALLASGLPSEKFAFVGYPPPKGAARRRFLGESLEWGRTLVLFESPHRIAKCLADLRDLAGSRTVVLCRELTKKFEEVLRGTAAELADELTLRPRKGEFTIVIGPRDEPRGGNGA